MKLNTSAPEAQRPTASRDHNVIPGDRVRLVSGYGVRYIDSISTSSPSSAHSTCYSCTQLFPWLTGRRGGLCRDHAGETRKTAPRSLLVLLCFALFAPCQCLCGVRVCLLLRGNFKLLLCSK